MQKNGIINLNNIKEIKQINGESKVGQRDQQDAKSQWKQYGSDDPSQGAQVRVRVW